MRLRQLFKRKNDRIRELPLKQRFELVNFISSWLYGRYMGETEHDAIDHWYKIRELSRPKLSGSTSTLYRLTTVPIEYADRKKFKFKPHLNKVSSWSLSLRNIDNVVNTASDFNVDSKTARVAVSANIMNSSILATPKSIKNFIEEATFDFNEAFNNSKGVESPAAYGILYQYNEMNNIYKILDQYANNPDGYLKQAECIVELNDGPIDLINEKVYRIGLKWLDAE